MTTTAAADIIRDLEADFAAVFEQMHWAEDEIARAQARHPEHADTLFHSFALLRSAASKRMSVEAVYRAHAREILERVAAGEDTRPGTAVEVVIGLLAAASTAPLSHEGFGLCARLWLTAGLPGHDDFTDRHEHIEALHAGRIDTEETAARRACRDDTRTPRPIDCDGWHHGAQVPCQHRTTSAAA